MPLPLDRPAGFNIHTLLWPIKLDCIFLDLYLVKIYNDYFNSL